MLSIRSIGGSLFVGILHAAILLAVALHLGYSVAPSDYSLLGTTWRYGGLIVLAAIPVWLAARFRILTPVVALLLTSGYVLGMEITPPGPTFRDVAELERLAEPTGIIVVENGLYIVRYKTNTSVWTVGFLFLAVIEYTVRTVWSWLPTVSKPISWASLPASRRQGVIFAMIGGIVHAVVMLWFAFRLGVSVSGGFEWLMYLFGAVGMFVLAAVPFYLLVRHQLVAPATLLTLFIILDALAEFDASVEDPHALYFGAWFVYFGILLVAGVIEYGLRRVDMGQRL